MHRDSSQVKTGTEHTQTALNLLQKHTKSAVQKAKSKSGCLYSMLIKLLYFNAVNVLIVDPMHD